MAETKNALAELAERLASNTVELVEGDEFPLRLSREAVIDFRKARRIVAELAKVSDGHWEVICDGPDAYFCTAGDLKVQCAIGRCRAIAEEGSGDGSKRD